MSPEPTDEREHVVERSFLELVIMSLASTAVGVCMVMRHGKPPGCQINIPALYEPVC